MPRFIVPPKAGPYEVVRSRAGTPLVTNSFTGPRKVRIPCPSQHKAEDICKLLNEGKDGEVFV